MPAPVFATSPGLQAGGSGTSVAIGYSGNPENQAGVLHILWLYVKTSGQTFSVTAGDSATILAQGNDSVQSWCFLAFLNNGSATGSTTVSWQTSVSWVAGALDWTSWIGDPTISNIGGIGASSVNHVTSGTTATIPNIITVANQSVILAIVIGPGSGTPSVPSGWTGTGQSVSGTNESVNSFYNYTFNTAGTNLGTVTSTTASGGSVAFAVEIVGRNQANKITYPILRPQHPLTQQLLMAFPFYEVGNNTAVPADDVSSYQPGSYNLATNASWRYGPFGAAYQNGTSGSGTLNIPSGNSTRFNALTLGAMFSRFNADTLTLTADPLPLITANGGNFVLQLHGSGVLQFRFSRSGGGSSVANSSNTFTAGSWNVGAGWYDSNSAWVYLNGVVTQGNVSANIVLSSTPTSTIISSDGSSNFNGRQECAYAWGRPLSPSEISWLGADPYVMFRRNNLVHFGPFVPPGAAAASLPTLKQNIAGQNITFLLINATSGLPLTGATVTVNVTDDNGTQTVGGGTVTELGNGQYNYAPTQAETNATDVGFLFSATNAIQVNKDFHNWPVDGNSLREVGIGAIHGSVLGAQGEGQAPQSVCYGTVGNSSTTTSIVTAFISNPAQTTVSNQLVGRTLIFLGNTTTSALQCVAASIVASNISTAPTLTVTGLTTSPANGDKFVIV